MYKELSKVNNTSPNHPIFLKWGKRLEHISLKVRSDPWTRLNYVGPLKHGFFFFSIISTTILHDPSLVHKCGITDKEEPQIQGTDYKLYVDSGLWRGPAPTPESFKGPLTWQGTKHMKRCSHQQSLEKRKLKPRDIAHLLECLKEKKLTRILMKYTITESCWKPFGSVL